MLKKALCFSALFSLLLTAGPVKYIAHRGDYVDAPEGTAAAYRFAVLPPKLCWELEQVTNKKRTVRKRTEVVKETMRLPGRKKGGGEGLLA